MNMHIVIASYSYIYKVNHAMHFKLQLINKCMYEVAS